jgi:hypothetical protein
LFFLIPEQAEAQNCTINANVDVIALGHGAHPPEQLLALEPLAYTESFAELQAWFNANI